LLHIIEEYDVGSERGKRSKKHRVIPLAAKSICEGKGVGGVHAPLTVVQRDGFEMEKLGKDGGGRFRTPAREARLPFGSIAHQAQHIGDRYP
jgi:hypothetical protein